jgi:hypothetical protein
LRQRAIAETIAIYEYTPFVAPRQSRPVHGGRFAFQPSRDGDGASVEMAAARHASRAMKAIGCGTASAALFRARTVAHGRKLLLAPS